MAITFGVLILFFGSAILIAVAAGIVLAAIYLIRGLRQRRQ